MKTKQPSKTSEKLAPVVTIALMYANEINAPEFPEKSTLSTLLLSI
jgi:hypothetical protein